MDRRCQLLIADHHIMVAECLQRLLEADYPGIQRVQNSEALLKTVATFKPDIVLIDIGMPMLNGIEVTRRLAELSPATKIIILTMQEEAEFVREAIRSGASGYVLKRCAFSELALAIRKVLDGQFYVTPLLEDDGATTNPGRTIEHRPLTIRQTEVLELVAEGRTAKEIASILKFSVKTAVYHRMAIMDKLGIRTTAQLTRYALEHGIISGKPPVRVAAAAAGVSKSSRSKAG